MVYQYIAYNDRGDIVKGKLDADNEDAASDILGYAGYRVINLKQYLPFFSSDRLTKELFKIKPTEVILFYRQLALLLESGINIVTALELLQSQMTNRILRKIIDEAIADLRSGSQFSATLSKHPEVFPPMYCRSLSVGEQTGNLEVMLRQIADYIEKEATTSKNVKGALMYPAIACVVTIIVVAVLIIFVLPAFSNLYGEMGAEMPALTKAMINLGVVMRANGLYIILGVGIFIALIISYIKTPSGKFKWHKLLITLPLLGRVNHLNELSRFCRNIALLFKAGLPLTEILPLVIQGSGNQAMTQALVEVQQGMMKGEGLSQPMAQNKLFLPMMVQMVKVGEETGNLETSLISVAQSYEAEATDKTRTVISMIQPVMTIIIAAVVGVIALSLVNAMYSMYGQAF